MSGADRGSLEVADVMIFFAYGLRLCPGGINMSFEAGVWSLLSVSPW